MQRSLLAVLTALLALMAVPVLAAKATVAVLPVAAFGGAPGNVPVITNALRHSLLTNGFNVVPEAQVNAVLRERKVDLKRPQTGIALTELRKALNADYIIYPRLLGVGQSLTGRFLQANILVNVMGPASEKAFFHTRQVGQTFPGDLKQSHVLVIGAKEADEAAQKLLGPFYEKVK